MLFKKPYYLLESRKFRAIYVFGGAGFAFLFLWIFEPFRLYNLKSLEKFISILLYIGGAFPLTLLQFFYFQKYIKKYTIGFTIIWFELSYFLIGTCVFFVHVFLYRNGEFKFNDFVFFQGVILSINILPTIIVVLIHYNYLIARRLYEANKLNKLIENKPINKNKNNIITLKSQYKNEGLNISLDSLFFITSVDNYIKVFYSEDQLIKSKLLRNSLSEVLKCCIDVPDIFRCHKSYIINKRKIELITGNAAGYKIKLKNYNQQIPVSRNLNREIKEIIKT